jgi:hypothetical protein
MKKLTQTSPKKNVPKKTIVVETDTDKQPVKPDAKCCAKTSRNAVGCHD